MCSRDAPSSVAATMMALLSVSLMIAFFIIGWMGRFYEPLGAPLYWVLLAAISGAGALFMVVFRKPILRLLEPEAVNNE